MRTPSPAEHPDFADLQVGQRRSGSLASFFIDLSNFTARSFFEPVEQLADFTELVLSAYSKAIEDHGGYVLDIRGDGIVAGFGGVNARPDINIPRALGAMAFCLRATRDTLNRELEQAGIDPTDVKASGDWGDILAIRVGARINYLGSRMNVAAKLEKFADEFTIVVGNDLAGNLLPTLLRPHADSPYEIKYVDNETKKYPFFIVDWDSASELSTFRTSFPRTITGGTDVGLLRTVPTSTRLGVTSEGRLVRPVSMASVATTIAPHRFHSGAKVALPELSTPWWDAQPDLLERERRHVAESFPGFTFFERAGTIGWRGCLRPWNREFAVEVLWAGDRQRIPSVKVLTPQYLGRMEGGRWRRSPHLYDAGDPCVARADDWAPTSHDATTVIAWTAHWLGCYEQWVAFRKDWPRTGQD